MTNKSVPSVVVVAALGAVAIGFGNALMDLATVAGGAALAWWFAGYHGRTVKDYKDKLAKLEIENKALAKRASVAEKGLPVLTTAEEDDLLSIPETPKPSRKLGIFGN